MVDNPYLKHRGWQHNGEVHRGKCKRYLGRDKHQHESTVTCRFKKNTIATSAKNTELIPLYYRQYHVVYANLKYSLQLTSFANHATQFPDMQTKAPE